MIATLGLGGGQRGLNGIPPFSPAYYPGRNIQPFRMARPNHFGAIPPPVQAHLNNLQRGLNVPLAWGESSARELLANAWGLWFPKTCGLPFSPPAILRFDNFKESLFVD